MVREKWIFAYPHSYYLALGLHYHARVQPPPCDQACMYCSETNDLERDRTLGRTYNRTPRRDHPGTRPMGNILIKGSEIVDEKECWQQFNERRARSKRGKESMMTRSSSDACRKKPYRVIHEETPPLINAGYVPGCGGLINFEPVTGLRTRADLELIRISLTSWRVNS